MRASSVYSLSITLSWSFFLLDICVGCKFSREGMAAKEAEMNVTPTHTQSNLKVHMKDLCRKTQEQQKVIALASAAQGEKHTSKHIGQIASEGDSVAEPCMGVALASRCL